MAQRVIAGSKELAKQIKLRRNELNLTIEEAASRAGVGTKTWSRYESGESIRLDKYKGICKALNWRTLPINQNWQDGESSLEECNRNHGAWSQFLENNYGSGAALSFAVGSDLLLDGIKYDMSFLASMPVNSHIGQLNVSLLSELLPPQFLTRYDYDFLYRMKCVLLDLRMTAKAGKEMVAHSVIEELLIYLCNKEAQGTIMDPGANCGDSIDDYSEDWVFDMFDDMDIITFLYSDMWLTAEHPFHFSNWSVQQFHMDSNE